MSKLENLFQRIGNEYKRADIADVIRAISMQVDRLTEGGVAAVHNASSAAPQSSVVAYATGDRIKNINPTVMGTAGAQYVVEAYLCVAPGTPGTWVEMRSFTGT